MGRKPMKAGRLLSKYIRRIAEENTEFIKGDGGEDDRMATKAEALARRLWKEALGWEELILTADGAATKIQHAPDAKIAFLLMDRMEGRAPTAVDDTDDRPSIAKKVTEQGLKRIKEAGRLKE